MIKQFSAGDITVRPFSTFKHWTLQSFDSSSVDTYGHSTYYKNKIEINRGQSISGNFYPSGSPHYVAENEPVNESGKYARVVYGMTDSMFYKNIGENIKLFGVEKLIPDQKTGKVEVREIHDRIVAANIKHNCWGEKIVPNSIHIIDNSSAHQTLDIYDDGYTNLYVTGSRFPGVQTIGGFRNLVSTPYWATSSGQFYVTFRNGDIQYVDYINAKEYMEMGLPVTYVPENSGSGWTWNNSTHRDYFQANNEHFGESVSSWGPYVAVGSSMNTYSLASYRIGYASVFKYDPNFDRLRMVAKLNFPFTQSANGLVQFQDTFGFSVALRDNFLAVGSPSGSACSTGSYPGYVCVYHSEKGGPDHWGLINTIKGRSSGEKFGSSVAIDDGILAIGAPGNNGNTGAVYIFRRKRYMDTEYPCQNINTGSVWQQVVTVDDFCSELVTGSYIASQSYTPTFVSGNYTWVYETTITSSIKAPGDNFGWAVSVDSDKLVIGTCKSGKGYAIAYECSYISASVGLCPTASWSEMRIFTGSADYGDLDMNSPEYSVDVSSTILTDMFGMSVGISGNHVVISSRYDKGFKPYNSYSGAPSVLGAAYFYEYQYVDSCEQYEYVLVTKTFGERQYQLQNNFGRAVSIDGSTAVVTTVPSGSLGKTVNYSGGQYILENYSYSSTGSSDGVLGRATIYDYDNGKWKISSELRRNKESGKPYNIYGYSVSLGSDYLAVGGPIVNLATASAYSQIINENNQTGSFPSSYSGSVFIYDVRKYQKDPLVGNVFYKNGYIVFTNTGSNYSDVMVGTGSRGFELNYQGTHTIFEHEYLVSVRPGEFNYSVNPSSLVNNSLMFDVNGDGIVDYKDADLIVRYLKGKKFYDEFAFDVNGIVLEQDTLYDYSWWANDIIQTEAIDVLQQETNNFDSSSFNLFTKQAYEYIEKNLINTGILDIDGNGVIDLRDGYIFALYVIDGLNPTTLNPYVEYISKRRYVKEIEEYLNKYCGEANFQVTPEFLNYQYSSSYDATGSFLAPYITTVGLYQGNELVAIGKLGRPIKNLINWPVNIVVRFDT